MLMAPRRNPEFPSFGGCGERTAFDGSASLSFLPGDLSLIPFMPSSSLAQRFFVDQTPGGYPIHNSDGKDLPGRTD